MPAASQEKPEYLAFISYRHADNREPDRCWATWLHRALETYQIPPDLVGATNLHGENVPARIYPIFRDEEEFSAEASLAPAIQDALRRSRLLIVLCSPKSVQSPYVAEEIRHFKRLGRSDRIIPVLLDGEPGHPTREAFPEPLRIQFETDGTVREETVEPLAADFRLADATEGYTSPAAYGKRLRSLTGVSSSQREELVAAYRERSQLAFLKIVAAVLAVPLATLTRRDQAHQLVVARRRARIFRAVASALTLLLAASIITGLYANRKRIEAIKARDSANDLVGFMLTDLHDQLSETGRLDVLSSAVAKVDQHLASNPVPPRLVADLRLQQARILFGQGRLQESARRAMDTLAGLPDEPANRSRRAKLHAFLGDVLAWGNQNNEEAKEECLKALGLFDPASTDPAAIEALVRTRIALGDLLRDDNQIVDALASYDEAWKLAATSAPALDTVRALAYQRKAELCHLNNQGAAAEKAIEAVLALVASHLAITPSSHPWLVIKAETLSLRSAMERYQGRISTSCDTLHDAETCAEQTATPGQLHRLFLLAAIRGQLAAHPSPTLTLHQREELFANSIRTQRSLLREDPQNRGWAAKLAATLRDHAGFQTDLADLFKDDSFRKTGLADLREADQLLGPVDLPSLFRERVETLLALAAATADSEEKSICQISARKLVERMPDDDVETLLLESLILPDSDQPAALSESHRKITLAWEKATGIRKAALSEQLAGSHFRLAARAAAGKDIDGFLRDSETGLRILKSLRIEGGDQPDLEESIALRLNSQGREWVSLGRSENAVRSYRDSLAVLEPIMVRYPSHAPPFREAALARYQLGKLATAAGGKEDALVLLGSALSTYRTFIGLAALETPRPPSPMSFPNVSVLRAIAVREAEAAASIGRHEIAAAAWSGLLEIFRSTETSGMVAPDLTVLGEFHKQALVGAVDSYSKIDGLSSEQLGSIRLLVEEVEKDHSLSASDSRLMLLKAKLHPSQSQQ